MSEASRIDGRTAVLRAEIRLGSSWLESPSAALGSALAGVRSACWIDGDDAHSAVDALRIAAGRHAPLVAHLVARSAPGHAFASGTGHDLLHALAETGAFVFVAVDAQEAADLTLLARSIAERALVPAVVAQDETETADREADVTELDASRVRAFASAADEAMESPSPAQEMLIGKYRRRVPRWIDDEHPAMLGPRAGAEAWAAGAAARRPWTLSELHGVVDEDVARFSELSGRRYGDTSTLMLDDAETVVVAQGSLVALAQSVVRKLREERKGPKVGVLGVRSLRPFPAARIAGEIPRGGRRIVVMERTDAPLAGAPPLTREVRAALEGVGGKRAEQRRIATVVAGLGGVPVRESDLAELLRDPGDESLVYLGLEFLPDDRSRPKRQALFDRLRRFRPEAERLGRRGDRPSAPALPSAEDTPRAVRELGRTDEHWDSLARFWNHTGVLYGEGAADLAPDPYLAVGAVPPLSAGFRDRSRAGLPWPSLDPQACTGCGACWSLCPEGSFRGTVVKARGVLDAGLDLARRRGGSPDVLRSMLGKLAAGVEAAAADDPAPTTFADAVRAPFAALLAGAREDRRSALSEAMDQVLAEVGGVPLVVAEPFAPAFLSLALDPTTCQNCGVCVEACEPGALAEMPADEDRRARDLDRCAAIDALPAAEPAGGDVPGAGAMRLLRHGARPAMIGGDGADPGSGSRLALRLALAAAADGETTRREERIGVLAEMQERFSNEIRHSLLDAVPTDDLDAISKGLRVLGGPDVEVAALVERLEDTCGSERVDGEKLAGLVDAAKDLADVRDSLRRANEAAVPPPMVLAGRSLEWACRFPANPFRGAVVVTSPDSAAETAAGLVTANAREAAHRARIVRDAKDALSNPLSRDPSHPDPEWDELDEDERRWASPVLLVLDREAWGRQREDAWKRLLEGGRPIVTIVLSDGSAPPTVALRTLGRRDVPVLASSVGDPDHLVEGLAAMLRGGGPAVAEILAPEPQRCGREPGTLVAQARRLVASRAFPLLRFDPASGETDLSGNPEAADGEVRDEGRRIWELLGEVAGVRGRAVERGREQGRADAENEEAAHLEAARRETAADLERRLTRQLMDLAGWAEEEGRK